MTKLCIKYGCKLDDNEEYYDGIVQRCVECGKKYVYNKNGGVFNERLYNYNNRRSIIQPFMTRAWYECYGRTKYGNVIEGEVLDDKRMNEEERKDEGKYLKEVNYVL